MAHSLLLLIALLGLSRPAFAQYHVESQGSGVRGNLWIGEGLADVISSGNRWVGHRLRIGGELHLGDDYQYILGITFYDRVWSGETSTSVGDLSRRNTDLELGYFFVPDRWWVMYSIALEDVNGSAIIGSVSPVGQQVSVGYRFFSDHHLNLAVEAAYLFSPGYNVATYNFQNNTSGSASFPVASIWSLNLRIGFDVGGGSAPGQ